MLQIGSLEHQESVVVYTASPGALDLDEMEQAGSHVNIIQYLCNIIHQCHDLKTLISSHSVDNFGEFLNIFNKIFLIFHLERGLGLWLGLGLLLEKEPINLTS